jgi:hypothetical protein
VKKDQLTGHQSQVEINRPKGDAGKERGWDSLNSWAGSTWRSARKTDQESAVAALGAGSNKPNRPGVDGKAQDHCWLQ